MPKSGTFGSVRAVPGNGHSYRDQFFSGMEYYEPRLPFDAKQIGRFRTAIGEEGLEQLLKFTIQTAGEIKAIKPAKLERVIVDSTVQEKAIAHPVDAFYSAHRHLRLIMRWAPSCAESTSGY